MAHVSPDTSHVREARVVVGAPVDDSEPAPEVGVDIDTDAGDGDDVRGRSMAVALSVSTLVTVAAMMGTAAIVARCGMKGAIALQFFLETLCYWFVDLSLCADDDHNRRCAFKWAGLSITVSLATLQGGIGIAIGRALRFVCIDAFLSRDQTTRRRSVAFIFCAGFNYLSCCLSILDYYEAESVGRVMRLFYIGWLVCGMCVVQKFVTSDDDRVCDTDVVYLVGGAFAHMFSWYAKLASFKLNSVLSSLVYILLLRGILRLLMPLSKRWLGDGWRAAVPVVVFVSELGPALLLMGADCRTMSFWALICIQEGNALLKNLGLYNWLYVSLRRSVRYPIDDVVAAAMEARRLVLAPSDNVSEVVAPIFVIIFIAIDYAIPQSQPVPSRGGALLSMSVALVVRGLFAVFEYVAERRLATPTPLYAMYIQISESSLPTRVHFSLIMFTVVQPCFIVIFFVAFA